MSGNILWEICTFGLGVFGTLFTRQFRLDLCIGEEEVCVIQIQEGLDPRDQVLFSLSIFR